MSDPFALSGGPSSGALVAGNPVVLKPSNRGALLGWKLYEVLRDAGVPAGAFHFVPGRGKVAGDALWRNPDVDGILFTGSYDVGMEIYRNFSRAYPKPAICEMGGKNPAIVTRTADLDVARARSVAEAYGIEQAVGAGKSDVAAHGAAHQRHNGDGIQFKRHKCAQSRFAQRRAGFKRHIHGERNHDKAHDLGESVHHFAGFAKQENADGNQAADNRPGFGREAGKNV